MIVVVVFAMSGCFRTRGIRVMSMFIPSHDDRGAFVSWDSQKSQVTWAIHHSNPDIIGFQNANKTQIHSLLLEMPQYGFAGERSLNVEGQSVYNPVFYKKDQLGLIARSQFSVSDNAFGVNGAGASSEVTWLKFKYFNTGHIFYLFNTSFCDTLCENSELNAIQFLNNIRMIAGNAPVIITGSFPRQDNRQVYNILTANYNNAFPFWDASTLVEKAPAVKVGDSSNVTNAIFVNGYYDVVGFDVAVAPRDVLSVKNFPLLVTLMFSDRQKNKGGDAFRLDDSSGNANPGMPSVILQHE